MREGLVLLLGGLPDIEVADEVDVERIIDDEQEGAVRLLGQVTVELATAIPGRMRDDVVVIKVDGQS